jgi:hypothetical protein
MFFKRIFHLNFKVVFIISLLFSCITSCVFLPETAEEQQYYNQCKMATKKLTLKLNVDKQNSLCGGKDFKEDPLVCLVANGVVASASIVVSGSIVLIGNTIHWLEYKTSC